MLEETYEMVEISFNHQRLVVKENLTVAVALWNEGIKTVNHNPKSNSSRGLYCGIGRCQSCLVKVDGKLYRSCLKQVKDGMVIEEVSHE
jgi:sarcosine oxidase, subunit alpha